VLFVTLLVSVAVAGGAGVGQATATQDGDEPVATFNATGTEGFVAIDAGSPDDPITFPTPDEVERPISLDAEVFGNGTWQSTDVSFPDLGEEQLGFPVQIRLEAPRPFEGTIDRETGEMTVDAALEIIVPDADATIPVRANLTTGASGEMQGETAGLDTDSATVTLVGNEFTVPEETGNTVIDGFVGLPAPEAGTNWFSLTLELSFDTETGVIDGVVESTEGGVVEGATVSLGDQQTTTGSDGSYEFDAPVGTGEVTVERFGFDGTTESVTVGSGETTTVDVELAPVATGTVAGTVESAGGDPVEGATVTVGDRQVTTGADGAYELGVETGTRELAVGAEGFADASRSVLVEADTVSREDIELDPANPAFAPVTLVTSDATVGETVEVTAFVQNTGAVAGTESVTVSVGGESTTESVTLGPAQLGTVSLAWETATGDEGAYEAAVTVSNRTEQAGVLVEGPAFTVDVSAGDVVPGDTVTVTATVRNSGDVAGERAVTVSLTGGVVDPVTESVELGPGEETEVSLEWVTAEGDAGEYEATAEVGGQTATERVVVDESVGEADFVVTSTGGYMAYGYDTLADAEGQGLAFPDKNAGEDPIRIWGVIDEAAGTWESVRTEFPTIVQEGLEGTVEAVGGLQGQVDREAGFLTATATYRVVIEGDEDTAFEFNMTMTTEESGEMTDIGSYRETNDTLAEVTFVSNEFRVDDRTGDSLADSTLNLPSPERGQNYVELDFEVDYDPDEQPDGTRQDQPGDDDGGTVETEASGTLVATVGQGLGVLGLAAVLVVALAGLYARVTGGDGETGE
jgi:hypothetical protein